MGNLTQATSIKTMERIVQGTAVNSTSGTSIDFTGIPSWAKRITIMFNGVSTSGTSAKQIQIGTSSGIETTGYVSGASMSAAGAQYLSSNTGLVQSVIANSTASETVHGSVILSLLGSNTWISSGSLWMPIYSVGNSSAGTKSLSGTLDRIRITTVNGTDTFDAGQINIMYEG